MSTEASVFSLKNPVMKDYLGALIEEYEALKHDLEEGERNNRKRARMMELLPIVEITSVLKTKFQDVEELRNLQTGKKLCSVLF